MTSDDETRARTSFIFGTPPNFFDSFDSLEQLDSPFITDLLTLRANLLSGFRVGTVPFQLVHSGVLNQRFHQLVIAEKIRCRTRVEEGEITEDQVDETATRIAKMRMDEEVSNSETIELHADHILAVLNGHLRDIAFLTSAQELLRQILVIAWAGFEIFVNDTIKTSLNNCPKLISAFVEVKPYRDFLSSRVLGPVFS